MENGIPKKVLVGDNDLFVAIQTFGLLPDCVEVLYTGRPETFLQMAQEDEYDWLVTDLNYNTENGEEGFWVLEKLQEMTAAKSARVVLWTSLAVLDDIKEKGEALGAEVYFRDVLEIIFEVIRKVDAIEVASVDSDG